MNMQNSTEQLLMQLLNKEENGINKVEWLDANDDKVCPLCSMRNGKTSTISEVKDLLKNKYCESKFCRCTVIAHSDD